MSQQVISANTDVRSWSDWMGVFASVACAIHCAAMPFVAMFLPMMGLRFLMDESFHQVMVVVCSTLAIAAFIPGFRRHRRLLPIGVGAVGLSLISTAALAMEGKCCATCSVTATAADEETGDVCNEKCCQDLAVAATDLGKESSDLGTASEDNGETASLLGSLTPWITSIGGLLLVTAHLTNRRLSCSCGCCPDDSVADGI